MKNYQKELEKIINNLDYKPSLLLHSCCAPCSSYVIEYLSKYFKITIFYYNPNIDSELEYKKRVKEEIRLIKEMSLENKVDFIEGNYEPERFINMSKGLENLKEGGARCFKCYYLRLEKTASLAKEKNFDFFTTTLSISPYKNANKLNEIGYLLEDRLGVSYLCADFKKNNGYKRSIELSKKYNLYRQDYCGCIYSKKERDEKNEKRIS